MQKKEVNSLDSLENMPSGSGMLAKFPDAISGMKLAS